MSLSDGAGGADGAAERTGGREKTRVSVRIAGRFLAVLTDEDPASVKRIEKALNDAVEETVRANPRMATREGRSDAVILCAVEAESRAEAAERRADAAEKRALAAEEKLRSLAADYARLEARLASGVGIGTKTKTAVPDALDALDGRCGGEDRDRTREPDRPGIPGPLMDRLRELLSQMARRDPAEDRTDRPPQPEQAESPGESEQSDKPGQSGRSDRPEPLDRSDKTEQSDRPEQSDEASRPESSDRPDITGRADDAPEGDA